MRAKQNQRGAALIELAFVIPILLVITFVITEFGRAIYQYSVLTKSVRDAARYLTIQTPNTKVAEARNLVVYGRTTGGTTPLVPGLTTAMVSANWPAPVGTNPAISTVTVQISGYTFQSIVLSAFGLPFSSVTFSNISATMRSHTT